MASQPSCSWADQHQHHPLNGDLNGDNQITPADAATALRIAVGSRPSDLCWDVSGDGRVTSLDALMILQAATGAIVL